MIVLIMYHAHTCPKWFMAVMTPTYIAFTLIKNWFGQTWAGMGNWYYMGHWLYVWNFRRKKVFFKISTPFLFWEWFSLTVGFITLKLINIPTFMKIQWTKPKTWMKMHYHKLEIWYFYLSSQYVHMLQILLKIEKVKIEI